MENGLQPLAKGAIKEMASSKQKRSLFIPDSPMKDERLPQALGKQLVAGSWRCAFTPENIG